LRRRSSPAPVSYSRLDRELAGRVVAQVESRFETKLLYARVDMVRSGDGAPVLMELEAVEPFLYLDQAEGAAERLATAIEQRLEAR
jgi:hypothetical protein